MTALHSFFAQSLPLLQQTTNGGDITVRIVNDNARGLTKESAFSERRRHYEAQFVAFHGSSSGSYSSHSSGSGGGSRSKVSRWESELPALVTLSNSPPAPQRRESVQATKTALHQAATTALPPIVALPKIPLRRSSVEEDSDEDDRDNDYYHHYGNAPSSTTRRYHAEDTAEETTSHSRGSQSSNSSRSSRSSGSEGSHDYALAPPRRRTSCLAWLDEVEANDALRSGRKIGQIPETKIQPRSMTIRRPATENMLSIHLESQMSKKYGSNNNDDSKNHKASSRSSSSKNAPRRPRRMKSMDPEDTIEAPSSSHSDRTVSTAGTTDDESSLRSRSLSDSIHSVVMEQVRNHSLVQRDHNHHQETISHHNLNNKRLTTSEQTVLKDAVKGVVGALTRRSSSRRNLLCETATSTSGKGTTTTTTTTRKRGTSPIRQRRESPPPAGQ